MIGTITLNPSIDQHIIVRELLKDDANRALKVFRYPGGKGVNVSKVVRELGGRTRAFALLGGIPGEFWKKLVRELDIPFSEVEVHGETRLNTILTDLKDGTQTRISAPGPRVSQKEIDHFLRKILAMRPKPDFWVLGGSLSSGMKPTTCREFIRVLQKSGVRCVLDTDNAALKYGIEAKPFMIKPNEYEIQRLVNRSLHTIPDYLSAAHLLVEKGIHIVAVSLGKRGAIFVSADDAFHVLTPNVSVKSKVGAGDSLIGGFVLGLSQKMDLRTAARLGIAASTSSVMREAPRLCLKKDIPGLLRRIAIRPL